MSWRLLGYVACGTCLFGSALVQVLVSLYAIAGTALFKGTYNDPLQVTPTNCSWSASSHTTVQNFDNFWNGALQMIVLLTTENFPSVLYP